MVGESQTASRQPSFLEWNTVTPGGRRRQSQPVTALMASLLQILLILRTVAGQYYYTLARTQGGIIGETTRDADPISTISEVMYTNSASPEFRYLNSGGTRRLTYQLTTKSGAIWQATEPSGIQLGCSATTSKFLR